MKSSPLIWHVLHNVNSMVKILSNFVAFLENINFKPQVGKPWKDTTSEIIRTHWDVLSENFCSFLQFLTKYIHY
jgi:hypothetical protein